MLVIILVLGSLYALDKQETNQEKDISKQTTSNSNSINPYGKSNEALEEYNALPIQGYDITVLNREVPCSANYTIVKKSEPPNGKIASNVTGFIESSISDGVRKVYSSQARTIVNSMFDKAKDINQKYKFGEITEETRKSQLDTLVSTASAEIDTLKLEKWNDAVTGVKNEYNSSVSNGKIEDCFDDWTLTGTSINDYYNRKTLELYGS